MTLEDYICTHIDPEPEWLRQIDRATNLHLYNPRMSSGHLQGRLLKMLVALTGARRVLELGTFSAYSTLCLAEGLPDDGEVHSIEFNDELEDFIRANLALTTLGEKVRLHIGDACRLIGSVAPGERFDLAFIDADKRQYPDYYRLVKRRMRPGGLIVADNTLWDGHVVAGEHHSSQTRGVMEFNDLVAADPQVEKVILPLRDGLTLIRVL